MNIEVLIVPELIDDKKIQENSSVIIDVFRATSNIITALYNGCAGIYPAISIEEAVRKADELGKDSIVLGGERDAVKIDKFDIGNSPIEYSKDKVGGKNVIITTTNGTKAIYKAMKSKELLIGSFLNASATAAKAAKLGNDISIICAGTDNKMSLEDFCCAGLITYCISKTDSDIILEDSALCAKEMYLSNRYKLIEFLSRTRHYKILEGRGFFEDIYYCLKTDITNIVPEYKDGRII